MCEGTEAGHGRRWAREGNCESETKGAGLKDSWEGGGEREGRRKKPFRGVKAKDNGIGKTSPRCNFFFF